ncbi:MAG: hypothetical protein ACRDVZ_11890, partial [Jiangellaceae bacterium]
MAKQPEPGSGVDEGDAPVSLAQKSKESMQSRLRRVRFTALPIAQSALGAALAWWIATSPPIDHEQPF